MTASGEEVTSGPAPASRRQDCANGSDAYSFEQVLAYELEEVRRSRRERSREDAGGGNHPNVHRAAYDAGLIGLAFSGGGIRSATFNLGVLQALAQRGVLTLVDYLSTVSGGGYIGSWLACWCKRSGGIQGVEARLQTSLVQDPNQPSLHPIRFLREYSNYLTPKLGFFSADTWTVATIWFRNTLLNQVVLISALAAVFMVIRILGKLLNSAYCHFGRRGLDTFSAAVAAVLLLLGCVSSGWNLQWFFNSRRLAVPPPKWQMQGRVLVSVVAPLWLASISAAYSLNVWLANNPQNLWIPLSPLAGGFFVLGLLLIVGFGWYPGAFYPHLEWSSFGRAQRCKSISATILASGAAGVLGAVLIRIYCGIFSGASVDSLGWRTLAIGTPCTLLIFGLTKIAQIGLLGFNFPDERREWWSRLGAWLIIASLGWAALCAGAIYGPLLVSVATAYGATIGAAGWVTATWKGVLAAKRPDTGQAAVSGDAPPSKWNEFLATAAPYVFVAGLVLALSVGLQEILSRFDESRWIPLEDLGDAYWSHFDVGWAVLLSAIVAAAATALLFGWRVDINEFSLNHFYRNRLVRCYLGASRPVQPQARHANPFTGFDRYDDPKLARFQTIDSVVPRLADAEADLLAGDTSGKPYIGPYPILNTALNLARGDDLAWQERKAESFVFTPKFCGFEPAPLPAAPPPSKGIATHGYRPTIEYGYGDDQGPAIGTAVAISGAAANPNMGYHTSPAVAVLMTFFNVRLGWWLGNPRFESTWKKSSPGTGLAYLLKELTRDTTDRAGYINLSDGGHFENLGIYELVRRRCRVIVACDAEEDHRMTFGGLANAIRKCRTDFGVHIRINLDGVRRNGLRSSQHFAVGLIEYPPLDGDMDKQIGILVYLKSSLTGAESADIREYADRDPLFPHQSTSDQWFDEAQFESYRKLGYCVASNWLTSLANDGSRLSDRAQLIHMLEHQAPAVNQGC